MNYPKILTIQDISCVGQCSLTVALPILSACGIETCILPSAVLSTHTAGFKGFTFRDLASDMPAIFSHWKSENIEFDGIYTGYLGSKEQVDYIVDFALPLLKKGAKLIVDPAFADNGKLYPIFNDEYVEKMKDLVRCADYLLPNLTEACFLTGIEYKTKYDKEYILSVMKALCDMGAKAVVLTGVSFENGFTGVAVYENGNYSYYKHELLPNSCHGTGDIYASAFSGALFKGYSAINSAKIAADYTVKCIKCTAGDKSHWYGAKFEPCLIELIKAINA
ncbi:MAG: pyridoxamine kinase [Clostridia bacterium]|nr:pyridoxamine kinase [Clostridia bacterium]